VRTIVRGEEGRDRVYGGIRRQVGEGRQAFVVVPQVEETGNRDLKAATAFHRQLAAETFPDLNVGLLHGRMKAERKEAVMSAFERGEIEVLVATTVVEVGVDVPNATVMVVEHAERFGLSQLHQLRGRVGRGTGRSYCVLMTGRERPGPDALERLAILEDTSDGFRIAERDLELRGPGAVFGTEQHGPGDLDILLAAMRDPDLLETARSEAAVWAAANGGNAAAVAELLSGLRRGWRRRLELGSVG
jgi:ATP-dependent DNA helicase RecG